MEGIRYPKSKRKKKKHTWTERGGVMLGSTSEKIHTRLLTTTRVHAISPRLSFTRPGQADLSAAAFHP